ncbi:hypothetical protein BU16DRAFT_533907 [Lophium mytilinum]|uniref:Uncharacterized protein n=1 Tax=Lophium mytilinum TaxID=390894 RepID=A0A6A6RA11_9PEZI|nr:hypothetical protein BU16DRAFT_533907 [Lophium mytilinum]
MEKNSIADLADTLTHTAINDWGDGDASIHQPFRLLDLPRELRDLIYEQMLFPFDTIAPHLDHNKICMEEVSISDKPCKTTIWSTSYQDGELVAVLPASADNEDLASFSTYRDSKYYRKAPDMNIFLANTQIYEEARPIFYRMNWFLFPGLAACLAFLNDRPKEALRDIRSIDFKIYEYCNVQTTGTFETSISMGDIARRICETISQDMELHHLTLRMHTMVLDMDESPHFNWHGRSGKLDVNSEPDVLLPEWVPVFLNISNLQSLTIDWSSNVFNIVGRSLAAVRAMRAHMIKNGQNLKNEGIRIQMRHDVESGDDLEWHRTSDRCMQLNMNVDHRGKTVYRRMRRVHTDDRCGFTDCGHFYTGHNLCWCKREAAAVNEPETHVAGQATDSEGQTHEDGSDQVSASETAKEAIDEQEPNVDEADGEEHGNEDDEEDRLSAEDYGWDTQLHCHLGDEQSYTASDFGDTDTYVEAMQAADQTADASIGTPVRTALATKSPSKKSGRTKEFWVVTLHSYLTLPLMFQINLLCAPDTLLSY